MSLSENHPYDALTPDCILDAVESAGFICDGRMLALNSYENRVYQVGIEDAEPVVVKFYRPARWRDESILEEHAFSMELEDLDVPVVAPVVLPAHGSTLGVHEMFRFAVFPRRTGRWPDLDTAEDRRSMGRFIGRLHACGQTRQFSDRPRLDAATFGFAPLADLERSECVPPDMSANVLDACRELLESISARLEGGAWRAQRIHGDFHLGNVLWSDTGPSIVDLDDCCTGPAVQDLWMLLSGGREEREGQLIDVLAGYREFADLDYSQLNYIEVLRGLRMVRYNGWIAARWADPAFGRAFPWFTSPRYWEEQMIGLREQLEILDEPPLTVH